MRVSSKQMESDIMLAQETSQNNEQPHSFVKMVIELANQSTPHTTLSNSLLANVGALPLVLRAILGAQSGGRIRIIVVIDPVTGPRIREDLIRTGRSAFIGGVDRATLGKRLFPAF